MLTPEENSRGKIDSLKRPSDTEVSPAPDRSPSKKSKTASKVDPISSTTWPPVVDIVENNWRFTFDELRDRSPSRVKQVPYNVELERRWKGVNFINQLARALNLSRSVAITGSTLFHRFYMRRDFNMHHQYPIAAACLFIATKAEEARRPLKNVVIEAVKISAKDPQKQVDEQTKDFWQWRDTIIRNEEIVLLYLCFDVSPESPYRKSQQAVREAEFPKQLNAGIPLKVSSELIFRESCSFYEECCKLALLVVFGANVVAGVGLVHACIQEEAKFSPQFLQKSLNTSINDCWRCYKVFVEMMRVLKDRIPPSIKERFGQYPKDLFFKVAGEDVPLEKNKTVPVSKSAEAGESDAISNKSGTKDVNGNLSNNDVDDDTKNSNGTTKEDHKGNDIDDYQNSTKETVKAFSDAETKTTTPASNGK
ncbi:BA75_00424T0 [Komagataella pastoris]|uniref:BA75_00424T0 n=1 Tax=Komagataella pastoris TaxID=4922 RepID=A0A1B2J9H8_PICPA|nr:BA75_00424T0 [Komagataella pastoris]